MIQYLLFWAWYLLWRIIITLTCLYSLQTVLHLEGYHMEWSTLLIVGVIFVIGVRTWAPAHHGE